MRCRMKVIALLQYVVTQKDGSEREIPLPDNCPDSVEMEVDSMADVAIVVPIAVDSHFKALGVERPVNLEFRYTAKRIDNPLAN